ncbi:hypothetical protein [Actinoplanes sp. NPDC051851]|uniref:hypothetical protein n=1 Tax=Actinoplanes sp. NPDC051851 TaxID=3154753 RepID=UPI00342AFCE2
MELTPEQSERLRRLLEDELRSAYQAARERGVPAAALDADLAGRRSLLEELAGGVADDPQDAEGQEVPRGGVGEQR